MVGGVGDACLDVLLPFLHRVSCHDVSCAASHDVPKHTAHAKPVVQHLAPTNLALSHGQLPCS